MLSINKKYSLFFLLVIFNINSITLDEATNKLSKEFNCSSKEMLKAFDIVKIDFKAWNILNTLRKDNFNFIRFSGSNFENEIIKFIENLRRDEIGNFTKVNIDDLKEHAKLRLVYKKYLQNSQNALFYYNPFLDETLIIGISNRFIVFTFLKFSSYYEDLEESGLVKKIYSKYFVYERATEKVREN